MFLIMTITVITVLLIDIDSWTVYVCFPIASQTTDLCLAVLTNFHSNGWLTFGDKLGHRLSLIVFKPFKVL